MIVIKIGAKMVKHKLDASKLRVCFRHSNKMNVLLVTRKSMPTVDIKFPDKNVPSLKRTNRHVLPTPESPSNIT